jgi:hypothetical protein
VLALAAGALVATGGPASARVPDFVAGPALYTVDTDALTITGPGAAFRGTAPGDVATFSFRAVDIREGATVRVRGRRAFRLVAETSLRVAGRIDADGTSAVDGVPGSSPGGPGGGAGGSNLAQPGEGSGGGGAATAPGHGGGGGGYGGRGARGGTDVGTAGSAGSGGATYGDLDTMLVGGSGGAAGGFLPAPDSSVGGGGGGGAVELRAVSVTVTGTGRVDANGGSGAGGDCGASGGGSGGAILIHAATYLNEGWLSVGGGDGGIGGSCGDGGGGGGGRVAIHYQRPLGGGLLDNSGGKSGARATGGVKPGSDISPDAFGADGVLTGERIPDTAITRARVRATRHRATFRFAATGDRVTGFQCAVHKVHRRASFKACSSGRTYRRLGRGRYVFEVRAFGPIGADPVPAKKRFRIR